MEIIYKPVPVSLDIVFTAHDPKDIKEIQAICRKHIKGYKSHHWNSDLGQVEFHTDRNIPDEDIERLYQILENTFYSHLEKPDSEENGKI